MVSEDPSEIPKGAQKSFRDNLSDKVNAFVLGPGDLFRGLEMLLVGDIIIFIG